MALMSQKRYCHIRARGQRNEGKLKSCEDSTCQPKRRAIEIEEIEHKLKSANDTVSRLQEKLMEKDQKITQLGSEVSAAKFEVSVLETRLAKQVADIQHKIGELTATNKHLEEKVMEYEERENTLAKQLAEAQGNAEAAKAELVELQKKLVEIE
ncbi:hypothetical protein OSTOST_13329, partial [Ostertagia ostertagi]